MRGFCGEILYDGVHSDICFHAEDLPLSDKNVKFLHDCLDEWLNNSAGEGFFWIGNPQDMIDNCRLDF